ncbi:MAG: phosphate ABC transporter permease PstA [Gammaproteobacteria bacterium]|nr:phosphate ABC transporter permease PstA [Gammaproteobacteria bacterium]
MNALPTNNNLADTLLKIASWASGIFIVLFFGYLLFDITVNGFSRIDFSFFYESPVNAGRQGGIAPMLISTLLILILCLCISLPIGIASAIYLAEYTNEKQWFSRFIRRCLNIISGVPSIVMGLFGYAFFVIALKLGFSLLSGALTLAAMVLPLLIRSIEDSLRAIPQSYRLNAHALGLSQWRMIFQILLPMASQGILLAVILSIGRAMAETAALLYTSGYVMRTPDSIMDSGRSLSVHIFDLSMNVPGGEPSAYASALTLIVLLLIINTITAYISRIIKNRSIK